jgi:hypothetical protein
MTHLTSAALPAACHRRGQGRAIAVMLAEPSRNVRASLLRRERLTVIADDAASPSAARG